MLNKRNALLSSAYMLVSHGSRDVRTRCTVKKLAEQVSVLLASRNIQATGVIESQKYSLPSSFSPNSQTSVTTIASMVLTDRGCPLVETGVLELASIPLHQQIKQFAVEARRAGCERVKVLPLFLLPGVHVRGDICAEVEQAQAIIGDTIIIEQLPYLGSNADLMQLWISRLRGKANARILFSHGTKRVGGNERVEQTAAELEAITAYLSVSPFLEEKLESLIISGQRTVAIQPYLLFEGRVMEAMELEVMRLQTRFPQVQLLLGKTLSATAELAPLIIKEMLTS